jgi:hypothetical protein
MKAPPMILVRAAVLLRGLDAPIRAWVHARKVFSHAGAQRAQAAPFSDCNWRRLQPYNARASCSTPDTALIPIQSHEQREPGASYICPSSRQVRQGSTSQNSSVELVTREQRVAAQQPLNSVHDRMNPAPSTSPAEGTAADRTPPGETRTEVFREREEETQVKEPQPR